MPMHDRSPAENQQTVEAAIRLAGRPGYHDQHIRDDARAALRDLAAQAELAAEMAPLLECRGGGFKCAYVPDAEPCEVCALLARLDGAR